MHHKMVTGFRRSLSFTGGPGSCASPCRRSYTKTKPYHARSTSLPCRSHPTLAHLENEVASLRSFPARFESERSAESWLADGLDRINRVHAALGDLLHRPQETPLRGHPTAAAWADRLLEDALRLADAYSSIRSAAAALKNHVADARAAIRRDDAARLSSVLRSHRRADKELALLAAAIKNLSKSSRPVNLELMADAVEVEVAGIIKEVMAVTATASAAIFKGIAALSSSTASAVASTSNDSLGFWSLKRLTSSRSFNKRASLEEEETEIVAFEKMEGFEECLQRLDEGSERVFRSLIKTRVSLLNSLSPSF